VVEAAPLNLGRALPPLAVKRVAVLLNASAGAFHKTHAEDVRSTLEKAFASHGVTAEIHFIESDGLRAGAETALASAKRREIDAVVIGGGDGSVRVAAGLLAESDIPLGVLPLGTLNHFAKDLGIPLDVDAAAATIAAGLTRLVDLGEVNGKTFVNTSSIGIYPYMVIDRERRRRTGPRGTKWMAMVPAFFRMLRHFPRRRLHIGARGLARPYRTPCLFVGNNEYSTELFAFGRRAHLDRGALWFYVVKPRNALEFFWMVCRLCFGRLDQARDMDTFELGAAEINTKTSRLPVALDGDVMTILSPLRYRSRPRALRVIVPETS
jgi:diacylglycerol kinase family enzyme